MPHADCAEKMALCVRRCPTVNHSHKNPFARGQYRGPWELGITLKTTDGQI